MRYVPSADSKQASLLVASKGCISAFSLSGGFQSSHLAGVDIYFSDSDLAKKCKALLDSRFPRGHCHPSQGRQATLHQSTTLWCALASLLAHLVPGAPDELHACNWLCCGCAKKLKRVDTSVGTAGRERVLSCCASLRPTSPVQTLHLVLKYITCCTATRIILP